MCDAPLGPQVAMAILDAVEQRRNELGLVVLRRFLEVTDDQQAIKQQIMDYEESKQQGHLLWFLYHWWQSRVADRALITDIVRNLATPICHVYVSEYWGPSNLPPLPILINMGGDVNALDSNNRTPLFVACTLADDERMVELLVNNGATIDQPCGQHRDTALMKACAGNKSEAARRLLEMKAGVDLRDCHGCSALWKAVKNNQPEMVRLLVEFQADVHQLRPSDKKRQPIHQAALDDNAAMIQLLVELKANVNALDEKHGTPLLVAAENGQAEAVAALIEQRANPNLATLVCNTTQGGNTPLHMAAYKGYDNIVQQLINSGADIEARNGRRQTPLIRVANEGKSISTMDLLVDSGAELEAKDHLGSTAFLNAVFCKRYTYARRLVERGANVNARNTRNQGARAVFEISQRQADENDDSQLNQLLNQLQLNSESRALPGRRW